MHNGLKTENQKRENTGSIVLILEINNIITIKKFYGSTVSWSGEMICTKENRDKPTTL